MADLIVILHQGRVRQAAHKRCITYPDSVFFAVFMGDETSSCWRLTMTAITLTLRGDEQGAALVPMNSTLQPGAGRLHILFEIVVPQVWHTLLTGLILSFVIIMSVLSVLIMINTQSPTLLSANIAFRINAYGDYNVANALGTLSLLMTAFFCGCLPAYQHETRIRMDCIYTYSQHADFSHL
ncbi:MAG: hypothetical protein ACSLEN_01990 [Candidatus Malihini olakiniferum]